MLSQAAAVLGKPDTFAARAEQLRARFHSAFFDKQKGWYGPGSQAAQAIPLVMGIVPAANRATVLRQLIADVEARGNTAGDTGYRFVVRALTDAGQSELLHRTAVKGYGAQIAQGVTSLAEAWDANPTQSQNHCMLGHIQEWLVGGLVGIGQAEDSVAFSKIVIRPGIVEGVTSAEGHYDSIRGRIAVSWSREGSALRLKVTIPPSTTADLYLPDGTIRPIRSGEHTFSARVLTGSRSPRP